MISKNEIKLIRSLKTKKFRDKHNLFAAEGEKLVAHLLKCGWTCEKLFCTEESALNDHKLAQRISKADLKQITQMDSPNTVLALLKKKNLPELKGNGSILMLDDIRDPGNLGTIIRLADWFGVKQLVCSQETVDLYNAKVVHSTMGSLANVSVIYTDLEEAISYYKNQGYTVLGTFMNGEKSTDYSWGEKTVLIMGNEANGISASIEKLCDVALTIPKANTARAESLNVAMATAVILGGRS